MQPQGNDKKGTNKERLKGNSMNKNLYLFW